MTKHNRGDFCLFHLLLISLMHQLITKLPSKSTSMPLYPLIYLDVYEDLHKRSRPVTKALCAWGTKQLSEWKEFLNYIGKLTSKKEPMWELNQILTLRSKLIFFDRQLKWDTVKDSLLSIPQRHGYLLPGAISESSLDSYLPFFDGLFFILLNCLESYSPKRDYENFLPMKKIIIGSQDHTGGEGSQWVSSSTSCSKPG